MRDEKHTCIETQVRLNEVSNKIPLWSTDPNLNPFCSPDLHQPFTTRNGHWNSSAPYRGPN